LYRGPTEDFIIYPKVFIPGGNPAKASCEIDKTFSTFDGTLTVNSKCELIGSPRKSSGLKTHKVWVTNEYGYKQSGNVQIILEAKHPELNYPDSPYTGYVGTQLEIIPILKSYGQVKSCTQTAGTDLNSLGLTLDKTCKISGVPNKVKKQF
jgi:hypothetical protein